MMKKVIVLSVIALFIGIGFTGSSYSLSMSKFQMLNFDGNTLYVGGDGPGNYTSIQAAIDDANPGDTVFVYNGTYYETAEVDKSINLIGEDRDITEIINEYGDNYAVDISVDWVNISGFTILSNYGFNYYEYGGISIGSCNNNISNNIIKGGWYDDAGIKLLGSSNNNIIIGNIILDYNDGIYLLDSSDNIIRDNNFSGNWDCIYLHSSKGNIIINNTLTNNSHGILVYYSSNNTFRGNKLYYDARCTTFLFYSSNYNTIKNNTIFWGNSLWIWNSNNNTINGNTISQSIYGINLMDASYNTIYYNNLILNREYGISCFSDYIEDFGKNLIHTKCYNFHNNIMNTNNHKSTSVHGNNIIYHNNIIKNTKNAYDESNNTWDNGYPSGGNFWDDYNGTDDDGDGIGDTPYSIPGGDNEDRYPLMRPCGDENLPPFADFNWTPLLPDPGETIHFNASDSIDYDGNITLYEWDWDNDGVFDGNHTSPTAMHTFEEVGYYPVTLRVTDNDNLTDSKTKTVRVGNQPPYEPSNPNPPDGATNVSIIGGLSWTGGDPDGDSVTYDVYFGTAISPPKVVSNQTATFFDLGTLDFSTTYYWKIVAWDNYGASTEGPIWSFTTRGNQPPSKPEIDGPSGVPPGTHEWTFKSIDPDGDDIKYYIDWGDGNAEETAFHASGEEIVVSHTYSSQGTYIISSCAEDIYGAVGPVGTNPVLIPRSSQHSTTMSLNCQNVMNIAPLVDNTLFLDDTTPPVTIMSREPKCPTGHDAWDVSDVTITLTATDDISGVDATYYRINEGEWVIYVEPFKLENDGIYQIEFYSVDNAGNEEPIQESPFPIKIDKTPPEIEFYYSYFWKKFQWYIKFIAIADDAMSGMDEVGFYVDNNLYSMDEEEPYEWTFLYSEIFGYLYLKVVAYDKAGNSNYDDFPIYVSYSISQSGSFQQSTSLNKALG